MYSTPTWQEAIQCKSRADTSGPRVAARLRSGTSLIRVRACNGRPFIRPHECSTAGKPVSRFLLRFCLFRPLDAFVRFTVDHEYAKLLVLVLVPGDRVYVCVNLDLWQWPRGRTRYPRYWSADSTVCISPWSTRSGSLWISRKFSFLPIFYVKRCIRTNYI